MNKPDDYERRLKDLKKFADDNGYDYEKLVPKSLEERMNEQGPPILASESPFEWSKKWKPTIITKEHPHYELYRKRDAGEISCEEFDRIMDGLLMKDLGIEE